MAVSLLTSTYGYARRSSVPSFDGTHSKLCPKCNKWFAAPKRARVCDGCQPNWKLAKRPDHTLPRKTKITRSFSRSELNFSALMDARTDQLTGKSFGCAHPRERQADHMPSARRHPFAGVRPEESGWCDVACNCACHIAAYNAVANRPSLPILESVS
jgi:hypothetical protein